MTADRLQTLFDHSVACFADRPAIEADGQMLSYAELGRQADAVAAALRAAGAGPGAHVAIFDRRTIGAFAAILGTVKTSGVFVPLQPGFPVERSATMLRASGARVVIAGEALAEDARAVIAAAGGSDLTLIALTAEGPRIIARSDPETRRDDDRAYLLFTSGSTGTPKGVPISRGNLLAYLDGIAQLVPLTPEDRATQCFELTFDLSVHDMFVTWSAGACLHVMTERARRNPLLFARDRGITAWFSVPSMAVMMQRLRMLKPGVLPGLRVAQFCGEPLLVDTARAWAAAAPDAEVWNLYGPTEATIAITAQRWEADAEARARNGVMPIGTPYPAQRAALMIDGRLAEEGAGEGELCVTGSQVMRGYLDNPAQTAERFATGDDGTRWYRTGDLVERLADGMLLHRGRIDDQIKLQGHRIELQEIDHALRIASGTVQAVSVAWPLTAEGPQGIAAVVADADAAEDGAIIAGCRAKLPAYMVPGRVLRVAALPLNANGKIDRGAAAKLLDAAAANTG